jgi:hypothetical protein
MDEDAIMFEVEPLRLIRLAQPVRRDGSMWAALLLRRPTLADHHAVASADSLGEQQVALLARLCDVPVAVIRELAWSDFRTLHEALRWSCD